MARIIHSRDVPALMAAGELDANETHNAYNALDSAVTLRVHERLDERLRSLNSPHARTSYSFVRAMQGPALDMMLRGVMIQQKVRQDETVRYLDIRNRAQTLLDTLADAVWGPETYTVKTKVRETYQPIGKRGQPLAPRVRVNVEESTAVRPRGLNPNSSTQLLAFFNLALRMNVEYEIRKTPEGSIRTPSANDKALRKWAGYRTKGPGVDPRDRTVEPVHIAAPFVSLILTIRDMDKMLSVLRTPLDPDGRMRCSYNVVGTENGRWSSSKNAFGRGTNLQNISPTMRRMFCADEGYRLISTDLEQAESRVVAGLVWAATGDDTYWRACESGDLHTQVCRMAWPELEWTDDAKADRSIADRAYPGLPKYSYRDVAKRIGHGSNYRGSAYGIAEAVGIPPNIVIEFQRRYFRAFPAIAEWHQIVAIQLKSDQYLDTPLQRRRYFFGRLDEDKTLREAIAYGPQSTVGELLNYIMWRVWARGLGKAMAGVQPLEMPLHTHTSALASSLPIQLLLQNHDAFLLQTPMTTDLPALIHSLNSEFLNAKIPFTRNGEVRHMAIPGEFVTGWNWAYKDKGSDQAHWEFADGNPDGLAKGGGSDDRRRRQSASVGLGDWLR